MPIEILPENQPDWMQFDTTEDILFMGEDAFWQTKAGAANPDQAILFRGGLGFFDRSTDGGKTWASVLGPASQYPPWFTAGDITWTDYTYHHPDSSIPRPTKYQITYRSYASNPTYTGEHAVLASYVVTDGVDTDWDLAPMWILYTFDDWVTSKWQQLVNENWSGYSQDGSALSFGTIYQPDSGCTFNFNGTGLRASYRVIAYLSSTKVVLMRLRYDDPGGCGDAQVDVCVANIAGQVITFGSWYEAGQGNTIIQATADIDHAIIEVDSDTFAVVEAGLVIGAFPNEWEFSVAASNVSGDVITQGTPVVLENQSDFSFYDVAVTKLEDGKIVVASSRWATLKAYVCNITGNTVSAGTEQNFTMTQGSWTNLCTLSSTKIVAVYRYSATEVYAVVGTVSGTTITWGSAQKVSVGALGDHNITWNTIDCIGLDDTHFAVSWNESDKSSPYNDYKYVMIGSVSGTTITFGSPTLFETTDTSNPAKFISLEKFDSEKILVNYMLDESPYDVKYKIGTISGTAVTFGNALVSGITLGTYFGQVKMLDADSGTCINWVYEDGPEEAYAQIINGLPYAGYLIESFGALQQIGTNEHYILGGYSQWGAIYAIAVLSETKVVLASTYMNPSTNESQIQVWVADISGETITEGSKYNVGPYEVSTPFIHKITTIDSNTFLNIWMDYDGITYTEWTALIQASDVSGTTIANGNTLNWESQWGSGGSRYASGGSIGLCRVSDTRAIVCWLGYVSMISISGNTISWLSAEYDEDVNRANICALTETTFVMGYQGNFAVDFSCQAKVGNISGSSLSFGSEYAVNFNTTYAVYSVDLCRLTDSTFAIVWTENSAPKKLYTRVGSVSGTVITFGAITNITPLGAVTPRVSRLDDHNYFISYSSTNPDTFQIATVIENNAVQLFNGPWSPGGIDDSNYIASAVLSPDKAIAWRVEDDCPSWSECYGTAYIINLVGGSELVSIEGGDISERYYAGAMSFTTNGEYLWIPGMSRVQPDNTFKLIADWLHRNPGSTWDTISYANWGESGKYPRYYGWEVYGDGLSRAQAIGGDFFVHLAPWPYNSTGLIAYGNMRDHADLYLVATHYNMVFNDAWADKDSDVSVSHVIWVKTATGEEVRAAHYYGGRIYALLNTSTGAELWESSLPPYAGGSNFTHKDDAILDEVGDNAMDVDERDGTIVIANKVGDLLIIASTPPPYTFWYNFTLSHRNDRGVTGLIVL